MSDDEEETVHIFLDSNINLFVLFEFIYKFWIFIV